MIKRAERVAIRRAWEVHLIHSPAFARARTQPLPVDQVEEQELDARRNRSTP